MEGHLPSVTEPAAAAAGPAAAAAGSAHGLRPERGRAQAGKGRRPGRAGWARAGAPAACAGGYLQVAALRVVVTGANGAIGRWAVRELREHGHDVVAVDRRTAAGDGAVPLDLEDPEATVAGLAGAEALVHLAAVPGPRQPPWLAFDPNVRTTFHVLEAARLQGLRCTVLASSIWAYGYNPPAEERLPRRLPLEEDDVVPTVEGYGLSKRLLEQMGREYAGAAGLQVVCMRYPWVVQPEDYRGGPLGDPSSLACRAEAWSYVDVRDVALACRLAVEGAGLGFATVNVGAADTRSALPSAELVHRFAPQALRSRPLATHEALYSIHRAHALLGYAPRHSWRTEASGGPGSAG